MITDTSIVLWTFGGGSFCLLISGFGSFPLYIKKLNSKPLHAFIASGSSSMIIFIFILCLIKEGMIPKIKMPLAPWTVIGGILMGLLFSWSAVHKFNTKEVEGVGFTNELSKESLLLFTSLFIQSIPHGIAIGTVFATGNLPLAILMTITIAFHNIPKGTKLSLALKGEHASNARCFFSSILVSAPQLIMAVPTALIIWFFDPFLPAAIGFVTGSIIYFTLTESLWNFFKKGGKIITLGGLIAGLLGMLLLTKIFNLIP